MHFSSEILSRAQGVLDAATAEGVMLATAESCTGGGLAALLTELAGSSSAFERGFVTYSNAAKTEMLGVPMAVIESKGAVSPEVAKSMAEGAIAHSRAQLAVGITGIAGPSGGTAEKPVGLVYIAAARLGRETIIRENRFEGDRNAVRAASLLVALELFQGLLNP